MPSNNASTSAAAKSAPRSPDHTAAGYIAFPFHQTTSGDAEGGAEGHPTSELTKEIRAELEHVGTNIKAAAEEAKEQFSADRMVQWPYGGAAEGDDANSKPSSASRGDGEDIHGENKGWVSGVLETLHLK